MCDLARRVKGAKGKGKKFNKTTFCHTFFEGFESKIKSQPEERTWHGLASGSIATVQAVPLRKRCKHTHYTHTDILQYSSYLPCRASVRLRRPLLFSFSGLIFIKKHQKKRPPEEKHRRSQMLLRIESSKGEKESRAELDEKGSRAGWIGAKQYSLPVEKRTEAKRKSTKCWKIHSTDDNSSGGSGGSPCHSKTKPQPSPI